MSRVCGLDDVRLDLTMIPKTAKRFAEAIRTDAVDTHGGPRQPWATPGSLALTIRACALPIAVNKLQTQTRHRLQTAQPTTTTPDFLILYLQHSIARLDARIEHLLIDTGEPLISVTSIAAPALFNSSVNRYSYPRRCRPYLYGCILVLSSGAA